MSRNPSVVIIGAGAAGIAAARRLAESGFLDVKVLEAQDRIGGRIHSVDFHGNTVDLGAQWCHGENAVYDMVKDLNLLRDSFNTYRYNVYYDSTGKDIDKNVTDGIFKIYEEIIGDADALRTFEGSFGEYFVRR